MAQSYSHHDSTRSKVGSTAHFVAAIRAKESKSESRLFNDPFAEHLAGDYIEQTTEFMFPTKKDATSSLHVDVEEGVKKAKVLPAGLIEGVVVRTRKIDDELHDYLRGHQGAQVCILGAGLDTRAWRLEPSEGGSSTRLFEVDFPEIFDFKLPILSSVGAISKYDYHNVVADLSLPGWTEKLTSAGFRADIPTFWLLEGFTGYLTAEEFHRVFDTMTSLSANGSRLVATFLTPATKVTTSMHRFTPEVPIDEVTQHAGWTGAQRDIRDVGREYGREWTDASMDGYVIVTADYNKYR